MSGAGVGHCPTCWVSWLDNGLPCWNCGHDATAGPILAPGSNPGIADVPDRLAGPLDEYTAPCSVCGSDATWRNVVISTNPTVSELRDECQTCREVGQIEPSDDNPASEVSVGHSGGIEGVRNDLRAAS